MLIANGVKSVCPVKMYLIYLDLLGTNEKTKTFFLFRPILGVKKCMPIYKQEQIKKLSYTSARSNILSMLKSVAGEHVNIEIHSLRSGVAIVATSSNVDERFLKRHGRGKSDSAKNGYIVDSIDKRLLVSKSLNL